jgi:hypothetical protein
MRQQGAGRADGPIAGDNGGVYEIKVKGRLEAHWLGWFEGMALRYVRDEQTGLELTALRGLIADQPALHGVLGKIRDLNLTLISLQRLVDESDSSGGSCLEEMP